MPTNSYISNGHDKQQYYNIHIIKKHEDMSACNTTNRVAARLTDLDEAQEFVELNPTDNPDDRLIIARDTSTPTETYYDPTAPSAADIEHERRKGFSRISYYCWKQRRQEGQKGIHRLILFAIMKHCWKNGPWGDWCDDVGEQLIADECWISLRTLQRELPRMVETKMISIKINPNKPSTYIILDTSILPPFVAKGHK